MTLRSSSGSSTTTSDRASCSAGLKSTFWASMASTPNPRRTWSKLVADHLDALVQGLVGAVDRGFEGAVEVVEHGKKFANHLRAKLSEFSLLFALGAAACLHRALRWRFADELPRRFGVREARGSGGHRESPSWVGALEPARPAAGTVRRPWGAPQSQVAWASSTGSTGSLRWTLTSPSEPALFHGSLAGGVVERVRARRGGEDHPGTGRFLGMGWRSKGDSSHQNPGRLVDLPYISPAK